MAEKYSSIAECCKALRLSANLAEQADSIEGSCPKDYLLKLLNNEIEYRDRKDHALHSDRYLSEFLHFKGLEKEFEYFKEHAHEVVKEDLPFPYLTL